LFDTTNLTAKPKHFLFRDREFFGAENGMPFGYPISVF